MKIFSGIVVVFLLFFIFNKVLSQTPSANSNNSFMIRHTVVLKLNYPKGSSEEKEFMKETGKLSAIPGVKKFEILKQTSKENKFEYGISMEFGTKKTYDEYLQHPEHVAFVQNYWLKYVKDFLEIDYEPM